MATIEWSARALVDLDRILDHLVEHGVADAGERMSGIIAALDVLHHSPMIGRPAEHGMRELVIGRGARGYVALYAYKAARDVVQVAAIRGQREARF